MARTGKRYTEEQVKRPPIEFSIDFRRDRNPRVHSAVCSRSQNKVRSPPPGGRYSKRRTAQGQLHATVGQGVAAKDEEPILTLAPLRG